LDCPFKAVDKELEELKKDTRTVIIYEAPHRLVKTLKELADSLGDRRVTVVKELTKRYETVWQTSLFEAAAVFEEKEPKGEYVLVLEGKSAKDLEEEKQEQWGAIALNDHMQIYLDRGMDKKEAMKAVAKDKGISKREIYQMLVQEEQL
jgi:16S rRNA (cytidine1402-2'-O)-methyltransferase